MGSAPPVVALGILGDPERGFKDTSRNIMETGEFVINLVPVGLVEKMNLTAIDAPAGTSEIDLAGIETMQSVHVAPPRFQPVLFHLNVEPGLGCDWTKSGSRDRACGGHPH